MRPSTTLVSTLFVLLSSVTVDSFVVKPQSGPQQAVPLGGLAPFSPNQKSRESVALNYRLRKEYANPPVDGAGVVTALVRSDQLCRMA